MNEPKLNAHDPVHDAILRRFDHAEWLSQFASVLHAPGSRTRPMTPFRAGTISRLQMAAEYIRLLLREQRDSVREITVLKAEIGELKRDLEQHTEELHTGR